MQAPRFNIFCVVLVLNTLGSLLRVMHEDGFQNLPIQCSTKALELLNFKATCYGKAGFRGGGLKALLKKFETAIHTHIHTYICIFISIYVDMSAYIYTHT